MQLWLSQIAINQQSPSSTLPRKHLGEVPGYETLPFIRKRTGNKNGLQRFLRSHLEKACAQSSKFFHSRSYLRRRFQKERDISLWTPMYFRTPLQKNVGRCGTIIHCCISDRRW